MLLAFTLAVGVLQGPKMGPTLPPGVDEHFARVALQVEDRLEARDFSGASKAAKLLPGKSITIGWDDSNVPAQLRQSYISERDGALKVLKDHLHSSISISSIHRAIAFKFKPSLPNPPHYGVPAGAAFAWSDDPSQPRLTVTLALQRGMSLEKADPVNVYNEVLHAIGLYVGLATARDPGSMMGRTELNAHRTFEVNWFEAARLRKLVDAAKILQSAVQDREQLIPASPEVAFDPKAIELGRALQGDPSEFKVVFENKGNAPLALAFIPDCGCVAADKEALVQAGSKYVLDGTYDTSLTVGDIHHELVVLTNDRLAGSFSLPLHVSVSPRYRFLLPDGNIVKLPVSGATIELYLVVPDDGDIKPTQVTVRGIPGTATFEPWSGTMADPGLGEPAMPRNGYKIKAQLTGEMPLATKMQAVIAVQTNSSKFPTILSEFMVQRGVIVSPEELYVGEVGANPRTFSLMVTGTGLNFHVRAVSSDWPHLKVDSHAAANGNEYMIEANYDGKATPGPVKGTITIETDDPDRPKILIPVSGSVIR